MSALSKILSGTSFIAISLCLLIQSSTSAQGLKGVSMPKKILGRLTYIKGNTDLERWKIFLESQPKLIGMSFNEVQKRFGKDPISERDASSIEYGLTQDPTKDSSGSNSWLHVKIYFRKGFAWKYAVEAVQ